MASCSSFGRFSRHALLDVGRLGGHRGIALHGEQQVGHGGLVLLDGARRPAPVPEEAHRSQQDDAHDDEDRLEEGQLPSGALLKAFLEGLQALGRPLDLDFFALGGGRHCLRLRTFKDAPSSPTSHLKKCRFRLLWMFPPG